MTPLIDGQLMAPVEALLRRYKGCTGPRRTEGVELIAGRLTPRRPRTGPKGGGCTCQCGSVVAMSRRPVGVRAAHRRGASKPDAKDRDVGVVGYEINFNRYFYEYVPPRPLEEIDAELAELEAEIAGLLKQVAA